jgi:hypothetical protein
MKNSKIMKMFCGLLVLVMAVILPTACNDVTNVNDVTDMLSLEEVKLAHRVAMEQAKNNFTPTEILTSLDAKIDYVSSFTQSSISKMDLSDYKIKSLNSAIEEHKNMLIKFEYTSLSRQKIVSTDQVEIQQVVIDDLESSGLFSSSEINLVRRISRSFGLAEEGNIPPTSIGDSISVFRTFYTGLEPTSDGSKHTVGIILAIAEESYDWWSKNPDAIISTDGKSKAILLPNVVAQDVAGAIVGAGLATGFQLYQNDGHFDWEAVAWAAGGSAIAASIGLVGKIAKWLS